MIVKSIPRTGKFKRAWDSMTPAKRRVAIAKDAIKQIAAGTIVPIYSNYFILRGSSPTTIGPAHKKLAALGCEACAIGAIFAGMVNRFDSCDFSNNGGCLNALRDCDILPHLRGTFGEKELRRIEMAYEGFDVVGNLGYPENLVKFFKTYPNPKKRLIAILKNIVANDGTFKP